MKTSKRSKQHPADAKIQAWFSGLIAPECVKLPSSEEVANTGEVVNWDDEQIPASVRLIAKVVTSFSGEHGCHSVVRWPDGMVAVVEGDLSTEKDRRKLLPKAYVKAIGNLLETCMRFADEPDLIEKAH